MGIQAQKSFVSMAQIIIALVQASGETNTMANTNTLANSGTKNLCVNGSNNYSFSSAG